MWGDLEMIFHHRITCCFSCRTLLIQIRQRRSPPGPAAGGLISGILKLFSVFYFFTSRHFSVMLLHVKSDSPPFLAQRCHSRFEERQPPHTPFEKPLKCSLKSNLLFLSKILENCTSAAVTPLWECQFQSISERALEPFPSPKTALPAVSSVQESRDHLSPLILLESSAALDTGAGQLLSDRSVTHADLVLLFLTGFECQPSRSCVCIKVCTLGNVVTGLIQTVEGEHYSWAPCCLKALNTLLWGTVLNHCTFSCQCRVAAAQSLCLLLTIQPLWETVAWSLSQQRPCRGHTWITAKHQQNPSCHSEPQQMLILIMYYHPLYPYQRTWVYFQAFIN